MVHGPKSWKSEKSENFKSPIKQILCHEIEPYPSKERAMHEGDNPSLYYQ
jgi:hypothetical protein